MRAPRPILELALLLRPHPALGRAALRLVPDWPMTMTIGGVGRLCIRPRRHRYLWLREPQATEAFPWQALEELIPPRGVFYDLGANIGLYARHVARVCEVSRIVAFEPWGPNIELLRRNLALGDIESLVTVVQAAVADREGELEFQVDDVQSTSGTLDAVTGGRPAEGRSNLHLPPAKTCVRAVTLDGLVARAEIPPPDVVKIDVEGAEDLVLQGAREVLARHRPALVVELHGAAVTVRVLRFLLDLGYACVGKGHGLPAGPAPVDETFLPHITGQYDLEFIVARPAAS